MNIYHRGLYNNRFDAPFGIGTMIWAKGCRYHCKGCFHQDRFDLPILEEDSMSIIEKILEDPFSQGIIYAGFEWLEQYDELLEMIRVSRENNLEVIVYTHYTIEEIKKDFDELLEYKGIYIKCGEYDESRLSPTYTSYGVPLASTNQIIYKIGVDV